MSRKRSSENTSVEQPLSLGCLFGGLAFCCVFVAAGSLILYYGLVVPKRQSRDAASWIEVPCVIESCELTTHSSRSPRPTSRGSTYYDIEVVFTYEIEGTQYSGDRYELTDIIDGEKDWKQDAVENLRPGTDTICYVNPDDHQQAVLNREFSLSNWGAVPPAIFVLIGTFGGLALIYTFVDSKFFEPQRRARKEATVIGSESEPGQTESE